MPNVKSSKSTPVSQFSSRGYLKAPCRKTWVMWTTTITTMADPDQ